MGSYYVNCNDRMGCFERFEFGEASVDEVLSWLPLYGILTILDFVLSNAIFTIGATELNPFLASIGLAQGKCISAAMVFVPSIVIRTSSFVRLASAVMSLIVVYEIVVIKLFM